MDALVGTDGLSGNKLGEIGGRRQWPVVRGYSARRRKGATWRVRRWIGWLELIGNGKHGGLGHALVRLGRHARKYASLSWMRLASAKGGWTSSATAREVCVCVWRDKRRFRRLARIPPYAPAPPVTPFRTLSHRHTRPDVFTSSYRLPFTVPFIVRVNPSRRFSL